MSPRSNRIAAALVERLDVERGAAGSSVRQRGMEQGAHDAIRVTWIVEARHRFDAGVVSAVGLEPTTT